MRRIDASRAFTHMHIHPAIFPLTLNVSSGRQWCQVDDSDGTSSSSCSETSRTSGEATDQDNNAGGDTGSTLDPATDGGVCVVANGGDKKAAIDSLVRVPLAELWSSSGGLNAGSGPTTKTHASLISCENGTIDESQRRPSPSLLSNDKYSSTDQCGCGKILGKTRVISMGRGAG